MKKWKVRQLKDDLAWNKIESKRNKERLQLEIDTLYKVIARISKDQAIKEYEGQYY